MKQRPGPGEGAGSGALRKVRAKSRPLGQAAGQGVLASLHPQIAALAAQAPGLSIEDLGSAALGADLAAMRHEGMDVRIFKT